MLTIVFLNVFAFCKLCDANSKVLMCNECRSLNTTYVWTCIISSAYSNIVAETRFWTSVCLWNITLIDNMWWFGFISICCQSKLFLWACFRNLMSSCRCCCPYSVDSRKQNGSLHNLRVTRIVSYHLSCWCTVYVVKHFMLAIEKRKHILCKCNWLRLRASQASNRQFCSVMEFYLLNRLTIDTVCILLNAWKY